MVIISGLKWKLCYLDFEIFPLGGNDEKPLRSLDTEKLPELVDDPHSVQSSAIQVFYIWIFLGYLSHSTVS